MLIIEGPDLVGKTTLAHKLIERIPTHMYSWLNRPAFRHDRFVHYLRRASPWVVQDRFHMSEVLYALMRRDSELLLTPEKYKMIEAWLRVNCGMFTVILWDSKGIPESRFREEEMYNLDQVNQVNELFGKTDLPHALRFDLQGRFVNEDEIIAILQAYLSQFREWKKLYHEMKRWT